MARMMKKKKVKKTFTPSRKSQAAKLVDEKHIGTEIVDWSNIANHEIKMKMLECLKYYNYFFDYKDSYKWAVDWVKLNRTKKQLRDFKKVPQIKVSATIGRLAKMHMNGCPLPASELTYLNKGVDAIIALGKTQKSNTDVNSLNSNKKSPADLVKEKTSEFIADIESILDEWTPKTEFSVYDKMTSDDMPYNTAKAVVDYYQPLLYELVELVEKKSDDLTEAYSHLGVRIRRKYMNFVKAIVDDAERYMLAKKAVRKPRKAKKMSSGQQIAKLKYMKESKEHKLVSDDPIKLIGADEVYLFNTKYRRVQYLKSNSTGGFEIKGTTVQNVDLEVSYQKTIRKPAEFLTDFMKAPKARTRKLLTDLKTKDAKTTGRVNGDTIILKVY